MAVNLSDAEAALYMRDGFPAFTCKICGDDGFAEFKYEHMGACGACVASLAHAFLMKHSGEPDVRFSPRDEYEAFHAKREAQKKAGKQPIPSGIRRQVLERDKYRCQQCGDHRDLQVDHVHPESKGGTIDLVNLQCLCKLCNSKKGARL